MARLGAGVRKRPDGTFEKRFTFKGKRYSVYGKSTKELTEKEQEIRNKLAAGIYTDNKNITLDKYFVEFINNRRNHVKGNTIKNYKCYFTKHISPALGKKKIQDIERREVQLFQSDLAERHSIDLANHTMKVLKAILTEAVNDEIIIKSPAAGIKAIKDTGTKATDSYHRALTLEEQKAFMDEVENDYYYEYLAMLLCSGMRPGEAGALMWKDIDYKNKEIHITKTLTFTEDNKLIIGETPKTDSGYRDIPLTDTLKAVLSRQRKNTDGLYSFDGLIFRAPYGGMIHSRQVNLAIAAALNRLEKKGVHIEHFTAHALRDTYATRFIENGGNPQTLKKLLGHSSLAMTMDLYAHVLPDTKQKEAENIIFDIAL